MSRYIRTKDGIYDISKGLYVSSIKMWAIGFVTIYDDQIIKQSDNLAELCDEFIHDNQIIRFESGSKKYFHYLGDDFDFDIDKKMIEEGIYGAIWTDKGLIYVAKMDNEGKLVLI